MKRTNKKLAFTPSTVTNLTNTDLGSVAGGTGNFCATNNCAFTGGNRPPPVPPSTVNGTYNGCTTTGTSSNYGPC